MTERLADEQENRNALLSSKRLAASSAPQHSCTVRVCSAKRAESIAHEI